MPHFRRYGPGAPFYDLLSGERLVYRVGRVAGIDALRLAAGDTVVDLGCGTGLNFPLLMDRIGPRGLIVGIDRSPDMLRVARRRTVRHRWDNVRLVRADATTFTAERLAKTVASDLEDGGDGIRFDERSPTAPAVAPTESTDRRLRVFDAAIATYALSVFDDWHPAWDLMREVLRPSGRIAVVDMARPVGIGSLLGPLALAACAAGGADIDAAPWNALERSGSEVSHSTFRSGHVHVVAGSLP